MSRAHSLDNLSSERAHRANMLGPCTREKNRVNGNEAHLLDERLRFGSAGSLTLVFGVMPPADEVIRQMKHCHVSS